MGSRNGSIVNEMRANYFQRICPHVCTLRSLKTKSAVGEQGKYLSNLLGVISGLGESVSINPWLLLDLVLFTPLEVALLETPVNTDGKVVRDLKEKHNVIT